MRVRTIILLLLLVLGVPVLSMAQVGRGSITGLVTDNTGAVIPGAQVTVTNTSTGVNIDSTTNSSGIYTVLELNPGPYRVEAVATNFKKSVHEGIQLNVDDKLGIDFKLQVGGATETVTVTSNSLLHTEDVVSGEVLDNSVVENFPNLNGAGDVRNVLGALQYAGDVQGAAGSGGKSGASLGVNGSLYSFSNLHINGGRTSGSEYLVDGIPITQNMDRQISSTVPTIEDTSQFKVLTNGIGAQYGHLSGGAVDLSTQSGTKALHGSFFDFLQSKVLDANSWDNDDTATKKPGFHQNDFGVAMGGPVYLPHLYHGQNKTFWFANYEGSRYSNSGLALSSVLNDAERQGDLSDMGTASNLPGCGTPGLSSSAACNPTPQPLMYDPYATTANISSTNQRTALLGGDGRHVPGQYLDPIIQQYMKFMPEPNRQPSANSATANNYLATPKNTKSTDVYSIRVDENFSEKSRMFARFTHNNSSNVAGPVWTDPSGKPLSNENTTLVPDGFGATLNYDYTFSPTLLLNARVGGNYSPFYAGATLPPGFSNSGFGYDSVTQTALGPNNVWTINGPQTESQNAGGNGLDGQGNFGLKSSGSNVLDSTNIVYAASLTKILGRHSLQFGYEGRRYYDNIVNSPEQNGGLDLIRFTPASVMQDASNGWDPQHNANGIGPFLMGLYSWNQSNGPFSNTLRQSYYASYVQDDFKARPNLTLSLGLRWETESPVSTNSKGTLTIWDPNAPSPFTVDPGWTFAGALSQATDASGNSTPLSPALLSAVKTPEWVNAGFPKGALEFVHTPQHPSGNANNWHPWNFAPRLGAAWQVRTDTVIRASVGAFYLPTGGSLNSYNSTNGVAYTTQSGNTTHNQPQTFGIDLSPNLHSYTDPLCDCLESPSFSGQVTGKATNNQTLNYQSASNGQAAAVDINSHMPLEWDWSFGVQYEVKHGFLFEATYNGNTSHDLLAKDSPAPFPASLYTGGPSSNYTPGNDAAGAPGVNATIYSAYVPSPVAGQSSYGGFIDNCVGANNSAPCIQSIGYLEYPYPYYGQLRVTNRNIGKSNFNALNLRVEHRLQDGFQILANFTYSKSMDDVGGPEVNLGNGPDGGYGQGAKNPQDVQTIRNVYGRSGNDEPWRFTLFSLYQIPLGRGRHWMNQRSGLGSDVLDYVVGGWNISGDYLTQAGGPIIFFGMNQGGPDSSTLNFANIYGNLAPGATLNSLKNPHWHGVSSSIWDPNKNNQAAATPVFDVTQFAAAQSFTIGNQPPVYTIVRSPSNWNADLSLSKNIPIFSADGTRYLQIRADDTNFLNHPGIGGYDTNAGDGTFGLIDQFQNHFNQERHIQLGARFVF